MRMASPVHGIRMWQGDCLATSGGGKLTRTECMEIATTTALIGNRS